MKIEVGKTYRTVSGSKAVVEFEMPTPYHGAGGKFVGRAFTKNAWIVCRFSDSSECSAGPEFDLVSEWVEKPEWCRGNPAWARWQAHDEDGECYWFSEKPSHDKTAWGFQVVRNGSIGLVPHDFTPMLPKSCAWTESLIEAPEGWGK